MGKSTDRAKQYREAARNAAHRIYGHRLGACLELEEVGLTRDEFTRWFSPTGAPWAGVWWSFGKEHDARILALCFMAAMVEAGDA